MFNWKVEEQMLTKNNHKEFYHDYYNHISEKIVYDIEDTLSVTEKFKILNEFHNGEIEYFIELNNKYIHDLENGIIKKNNWGCAKESSRKAWIRKNDNKNVFWNGKTKDNFFTKEYYHSKYFGYNNNWYFGYTVDDEKIEKSFHNLLVKLHEKEKAYFREHDEYEILKTKFRNYGCPCFNSRIGSCSDGKIYVYNEENDYTKRKEREITIDELKLLISKYEQLKAYEKELEKEVNISF